MRLIKISDQAIERMVSVVLRTGVMLAAAVVLTGGIYELVLHGDEAAKYSTFSGVPAIDHTLSGIVHGAVDLRARSIIQFGIVVLIATPIARVAFSLVGFALERDGEYVAITSIVLAVLLYSLISGAGLG